MTFGWNFEQGRLGKVLLGYGLTFGLPLHVFVVCCWGGRVAPLRAWSKSSLTLFSLLRLSSLSPLVVICANGFVVVCCWWGGMVVVLCTCLLLPVGGCPFRRGEAKAVTVSGSLSSDLLIMHGWEVWLRLFSEGWAPVPPASFTSLTSPAWHLFIYLLMGWKRVLFSQSRA